MKFKMINQRRGFTLVEIMIVVAIIGLLAAMAIPNYIRARANAQASSCVNNLRQLSTALNQYAIENHLDNSATVALTALKPYLKLNAVGSIPPCPASGTYSVSTVTNEPTCSIGTTANPPHQLN